jgi:hypothetical protein
MTEIKKRGGFRKGSGRKKGEPSTVVRVPNGLLSEVKRLIDSYKSNPEPSKAPKSNPEPSKAPKSNPEPSKAPKSNPEPSKAPKSNPEFQNVSVDVLLTGFGGLPPKPKSPLSKNAKKRQRKKKR